MVLKEIVPKHGRVAIGGVLDGRLWRAAPRCPGRFCAIEAHSPALYLDASRGPTPPSTTPRITGATTSSATLRGTRRRSGSTSGGDPLGTRPFNTRIRSTRRSTSGRAATNVDYWYAHEGQYFAWYASCAAPREAFPKIELHVHLEGTVRAGHAARDRAAQRLRAARRPSSAELYRFRDFRHFIEVWILTTNALRTEDDFRQIVVDYAAEAAGSRRRLSRGDLRAGRARPARRLVDDDLRRRVRRGARRRREVEIRLTPDIARGFTLEEARETVEWSARYRDRGVVAVGLGGLEARVPARAVRRRCSRARGRSGSARSRTRARSPAPRPCGVRSRHSAPTGSGTASARSRIPGSSRELAGRGTVLDVCPLSNLRTGAVASLEEHPLPQLVAAGVPLLDLDRRPRDVRHRPRRATTKRPPRSASPARVRTKPESPGRSATRPRASGCGRSGRR